MKVLSFVFALLFFINFYENLKAADLPCQDWTAFKDEKCFRIVDDTLKTYDEAEKMCASLDDSSTLPIVHSSEEQNFLTNFQFKTHNKLDNFWIGGKFTSIKFSWIDKSELDFANWGVQGPRNKSNYCIQMQSDEAVMGKWIDKPCEKKNAFVCQKMQSWSILRLQKTLLDSRKELRDSLDQANKKITEQAQKLELSNKKINEQKQQLLAESNKNIIDLKQSLIPIGFIYTQLPSDKAPNEIWPWMAWTDVSSSYAGVFFRVTGGDAAPFGQIQEDNAPRITRAVNEFYTGGIHDDINLPKNALSDLLFTGGRDGWNIFLKFFTSGGEVRPRNMAMRVWKRTG